jgi:hypothetical protein
MAAGPPQKHPRGPGGGVPDPAVPFALVTGVMIASYSAVESCPCACGKTGTDW